MCRLEASVGRLIVGVEEGYRLMVGSLHCHSCFSPHFTQLSTTPALPKVIYPGIAPLYSKHSQQKQQGDVVGVAAKGGASVLVPVPTADQEVFSKQDAVPGAVHCGCGSAAVCVHLC